MLETADATLATVDKIMNTWGLSSKLGRCEK
jgi:hypothetical protein